MVIISYGNSNNGNNNNNIAQEILVFTILSTFCFFTLTFVFASFIVFVLAKNCFISILFYFSSKIKRQF